MTPIEQAAQALRELVELHDIKGRIDRADSWEREESRAHMDRVEAYGARIGTAWRNARAALTSLEAAKQEPLTAQDKQDLERLDEVFSDGEGYDIPKERMKRLAELGAIRHIGGGVYQFTSFGMHCLEREDWPFPLRTFEETNAALKAAAAPSPGSGT